MWGKSEKIDSENYVPKWLVTTSTIKYIPLACSAANRSLKSWSIPKFEFN